MGFGRSVVQRLLKTSVKKNLYWEAKEKVIEEAFNGYRMDKVKRMVKVYGLNTNKAIRARLIEILMERVRYHKDKFVTPLLYEEMRAMEVKKSGKVEHSDHTHDDTVFSYLMALYVWYDGKNLIENFGIRKSTLLTDENVETIDDFFEDAIEKKARISINNALDDDNLNITETLEWVESSVGIKKSADLYNDQFLEKLINRNNIMASHPELNQKMIDKYGINTAPNYKTDTHKMVDLPDDIFISDHDIDLYDSEDLGLEGNFSTSRSPLAGNLSQFYDLL